MELNNRIKITYKQCLWCGGFVRMMCQIGTGFCSQQCSDNWKTSKVLVLND